LKEKGKQAICDIPERFLNLSEAFNMESASLGIQFIELLDSEVGKAASRGGGSGTTHLALKDGCASLAIPHIIDEIVWNQIIADFGAGPKGGKLP
jgi:hypothetical protein